MRPQAHLASLSRRIAAFIIDTLLLVPIVGVLMAAIEGVPYEVELEMSGSLLAFVVFHWMALSNRNYDLGRVIMGIQVVSLRSGPELSAFQCFARPVARAVMGLASLGVAITAHEPLVLFTPLLVDLLLLTFHPMRQTVADMVGQTAVVSTPPLQPHRAPAGPMFSRDDAEFGPRPGKNGG